LISINSRLVIDINLAARLCMKRRLPRFSLPVCSCP
jgi:hypothetical protein